MGPKVLGAAFREGVQPTVWKDRTETRGPQKPRVTILLGQEPHHLEPTAPFQVCTLGVGFATHGPAKLTHEINHNAQNCNTSAVLKFH